MIVGSIVRLPLPLFISTNHFGLVTEIRKDEVDIYFDHKLGSISKNDILEIGRFVYGRKYRFLPSSPQFQEIKLILYKSGYENDLYNSFGNRTDIKITDDCYTNVDIKKAAFDKLEEYYYKYIEILL